MPGFPTAATLVAALLILAPGILPAQSIAPPCPSSVWNAGQSPGAADSASRTLPSEGWSASKGATVGGVIGVLLGVSGGLWKCRNYGAFSGRSCGGDMAWGAVLVGGLGMLLGSLAGADAERH
jgi:hypothetical protein